MLEVTFLQQRFANPLVLASGILGVTGAGMARVVRNGAAGVTMKSVTVEAITGNPNPVMVGNPGYFLNAVGLPGPGVESALPELAQFRSHCDGRLIGSVFGRTIDEFVEAARVLCAGPIDLLEVDISCPHAKQLYARPFAYDISLTEEITRKVKAVATVPVIMKLSPNVWNIGEFAKAAEAAGADAITAINTVNGMQIQAQARQPILANKVGGVSGPAIKPLALKAVWDIFEAVKIPIIGTGGVTSGTDAIEMLLAGARLVGVGSAFYYRGEKALKLIGDEITAWMEAERVDSIEEFIGAAHA
jgi:dihydroorotate dehydrogenase (NAD+) catalytic subunit